MGSKGWTETTLGEVCRRGGGSIQTGPFGSQLHAADYVPVGIPSIMPVNIGDSRIVEEGISRITEADAQRLHRHRVKAGNIIYSRRGDVERCALARREQEGWLCGTGCLKVDLGQGIVDPLYASYYLSLPDVRAWIVRHAVGATMPNLNTQIMEAVPFVLPPMEIQERVANILGSLDDKIELNRRMNETLEGMARAIFKSWFVDFLPVRAKMAAADQAPYVSTLPIAEKGKWFVYALACEGGSIYIGQTEDLRQRWQQHSSGKGGCWTKRHPPVRVVHWELVPSRRAAVEREKWLKTGYGRKWLKGQIAATDARTQTGDPVRLPAEASAQAGAKAEGRKSSGMPAEVAALFPDAFENSPLGEIPTGWKVKRLPEAIEVNPRRTLAKGQVAPYLDMQNMPVRRHRADTWIDREFGSGMKFTNGDTLVARITPCLENGKTAFVDFLKDGQVGWGSTEYIVFRPRPPIPAEFAYYLARSDDFRSFAIQNMTGTSGRQRVPADCLSQYLLTVPPEPVARSFGEMVRSFMEKIRANSEEAATLSAIRDALLPKLLSGEIAAFERECFAEVDGR